MCDVDGGSSNAGEPAQHDERVAGAPARALGAGHEQHQLGVVRSTTLGGPPREIVEQLVVLAFRGVDRGLAARGNISARGR